MAAQPVDEHADAGLSMIKNDRELLNYLLKIERQYDQHQLSESYSIASGHR